MIIKLIKHGESELYSENLSPNKIKGADISLTPNGIQQALDTGTTISSYMKNSLIYCCPYKRTRQTLQYILKGADIDPDSISTYEDPRLRDIDLGYQDTKEQLPLRRLHGWFYYRFEGGESPADCYDRTSSFLESMMREVKRSGKENILIICHGMTLRCFVARFLHLSVEQFEDMHNPDDCGTVTIGLKDEIDNPTFTKGRWAVNGLRLRGLLRPISPT